MTSAGRPQRGGMGIGAVLSQLRAEFPGVTISKIRFLEAEGLVRPARTASGYRRFSASDVERLRYVLTAQRDHYLPLKVIREQLDAADDGLSGPAPVGPVPLSAERDVDHGRGEQQPAGRPWSTTRRQGGEHGARSGDEVPAAREAEHPLPTGSAP
uniref:transcriptional regulator FtsR n=1 Tax=Actinosynnema sp. TaxID=1872144 RepID=UPI003F83D19A